MRVTEFQDRLDPRSADTGVPAALELLNRSALSGGKRFRSRLMHWVAEPLKIADDLIAPYAVAAERIHSATLLHDDVIDESDIRRGRPTLSAAEGNRKAVLAGDLLLARSLLDLGLTDHREILRDLFQVLVELTEGEWLQLEARGSIDVTERHLRTVAEKKTASLIAWCCSVPARIAKLPEREVQNLASFGRRIGVAFQMLDDCMDFDPESGKPVAQDLREGQISFMTYQVMGVTPGLRPLIATLLGRETEFVPSREFRSVLALALDRVDVMIEAEIAAARAHLRQSAIELVVVEEMDRRILAPLQKRKNQTIRRIHGSFA